MKVMLNTNNFNSYNQQNTSKRDNSKPMFKGGFYNSLTDKMAQGLADLAKKQNTVKFVDWMAKKDVVPTMAASTGIVISGFYMYNTAKSKKIEQEQKKPLIINMGLVTLFSTMLAHFINKSAYKKMDDLENYFVKKNSGKMNPQKLDFCKKGVKPAVTLLIFTSIYRYVAPVIATPLANKISNVWSDKKSLDKKA